MQERVVQKVELREGEFFLCGFEAAYYCHCSLRGESSVNGKNYNFELR